MANVIEVVIRANDQFSKALKKAGTDVNKLGTDVSKAGTKFLVAGGVMAAGLGVALKKAGDFQEQMTLVDTMLGEQSGKTMPGFTAAMKDMSVTYGQSTETLSKGLYDILSASVPTEFAISTLETAVRAAEAGFVDAALTADGLTTVMNAYQMSAQKSGDVSDWFFSVIEKGKTTMAELAPAVGNVLPIANSLNVGLEDVGAALTTMTKAGIKTDVAVTSLRGIMNAFLTPSEEMIKLTKKWGFESSQTAIKQLGLKGVIEKLQGVSAERIPKIFTEIRALTGLSTILNNTNGFMADRVAITERAGKTDEMFAKRQANVNVQMRKLKESITLLTTEVGETMIPIFKELADKFLENIQSFRKFVSENKELVATIGKTVPMVLILGGVLLKVVGSTLKFIGTIQKAIPVLKAFGITSKMLSSAVGPAGLGLAIAYTMTNLIKLNALYKDAKKSTEEFQAAADKELESIAARTEKVKEWEGQLKGLFLLRAQLLQAGQKEGSQAIKNVDERIAKLREETGVVKEAVAEQIEAGEKKFEFDIKALEDKAELTEEVNERLAEIREENREADLGEAEYKKALLEEEMERLKKAGIDETLIASLGAEERKAIARIETEEKKKLLDEQAAVKEAQEQFSRDSAKSSLDSAISLFGKESAEGKLLAKAKIAMESGTAIAKIWSSAAGMGPLAPIFAALQTALIIPNITKQFGRINAMAKGGMVNEPTLILAGEEGPEMVVPMTGPNRGRGMGSMVKINNITIQFPNVTTFEDWKKASPEMLKDVFRRKFMPTFKALAREGTFVPVRS